VMVGQDLDHAALGNPPSVAPGDHALELGPERGEPFEAALDIGQVGAGDPVGIVAGPVWTVREPQQVADGPDRKPQLAGRGG
jgi:hypothetical protein